jgi:hypothetical protein
VVLALCAAPAQAVTFGPAEPIPGTSAADRRADVATDAAGNATAVIFRGADEVAIAERPAGGPWGEPEKIDNSGFRQGLGLKDNPLIDMNESGAALVLWRCTAGLCAVTREATGAPWSDVQSLWNLDLPFARGAVAENGDMAVAFSYEEEDLGGPDDQDIARARFRPAGGPWGGAQILDVGNWTDNEFRIYDVGFDGEDQAHVLYVDLAPADGYGLKASYYDDGLWKDILAPLGGRNLEPPDSIQYPGVEAPGRLEALPDGSLLALWEELTAARKLWYAVKPHGDTWKPFSPGPAAGPITGAVAYSDTDVGSTLSNLELDVSAAGDVLLTFLDPHEGGTVDGPRARAKRHRAGTDWENQDTAWDDAETLREGDGLFPLPLVRQDGAAAAVWADQAPVAIAAAAADTFSSAWVPTPLASLAGLSLEPPFATGGGALIAGWWRSSGGGDRLFTRSAEPADDGDPGNGGQPNPPPSSGPSQNPPAPSAQPTPQAVRLLGARARCPRPAKKGKKRRKRCRPTITLRVNGSATATVTVYRLVKGKRKRLGKFKGKVAAPQRKLLVPKRVGRRTISRGTYILVAKLPGDRALQRAVVVR